MKNFKLSSRSCLICGDAFMPFIYITAILTTDDDPDTMKSDTENSSSSPRFIEKKKKSGQASMFIPEEMGS